MVPLTIATSYGFIMPVGTPPNAIVFATGHVTAGRMAKVGLPLDIIGIIGNNNNIIFSSFSMDIIFKNDN